MAVRRGRRPDPDLPDDPGLPRQRPRHDGRVPLGAALGAVGLRVPGVRRAARSTPWCSAGVALAFSRLIFNAVVVLENIFRHLEMGESAGGRGGTGGQRSGAAGAGRHPHDGRRLLPGHASSTASAGSCSRALALAVVLSLFASYVVAMTVVPLFCAQFLRPKSAGRQTRPTPAEGVGATSAPRVRRARSHAHGWIATSAAIRLALGPAEGGRRRLCWRCSCLSFGLYPLLGVAFFPRTDAGQFVINLKAPSGHAHRGRPRQLVKRVENLVADGRAAARPADDRLEHRRHARLLVDLHEQLRLAHGDGAGEPLREAPRRQLRLHGPRAPAHGAGPAGGERLLPVRRPAGRGAQPGPAGADRRAGQRQRHRAASTARPCRWRRPSAKIPGVRDVFIPQDLDYPALRLDVEPRARRASSGSTRRRSSTTSSRRSPRTG